MANNTTNEIVERAIALLDQYAIMCQELANQAWAHVPESGDMQENYIALYDQIDADFEQFRANLLFVTRSAEACMAVQAYQWNVEREL